MRENENEGQGSVCDIDLASILLEIEPGYVVVEEPSGNSKVLFVPPPMTLGDGLRASLGFELDGHDGVLGKPVFLHSRMQIRQLGNLEDYLEDPFVQSCVPEVTALIDQRLGVLPVIAVIEALRIDPGADVAALVSAVLEHRKALWSAATRA